MEKQDTPKPSRRAFLTAAGATTAATVLAPETPSPRRRIVAHWKET